jgi:hypothetical protein
LSKPRVPLKVARSIAGEMTKMITPEIIAQDPLSVIYAGVKNGKEVILGPPDIDDIPEGIVALIRSQTPHEYWRAVFVAVIIAQFDSVKLYHGEKQGDGVEIGITLVETKRPLDPRRN